MRASGCASALVAALAVACGSPAKTGLGQEPTVAPSAGGPADAGSAAADAGSAAAVKRALAIRVAGSGAVQGAGADCTGTCAQQFDDGQSVHLVAVPQAGFRFDGWQGDCAGAGACDLNMSADRSVAASFAPIPPALIHVRVSLTGEGQGQVTSSPAGINCPGRCEMEVPAGTNVTLTGSAGKDSMLSGWGGACTNNPCSFTANADAVVYAGFHARRHTLTINVNGPGRVQSSPAGIDCPGQCTASFEAHSLVVVHATPNAGNYFQDWGTACGESYGADCGVFMHGDYSATATFSSTQRLFKLVVYQAGYGTGRVQSSPPGIDCTTASPSCSGQFAWGTQVTLTATAAAGSTLSGWGNSCAGTGPCSVELNGNRFATVTFDAPPPAGGRYTVRELPAVEGSSALSPSAINSRGDVVGSVAIAHSGQPTAHAFLYDAIAGTSARIGDDGAYAQAATAINDARQIVLNTTGANGNDVYRWEAGALTLIAGWPSFYMVGSSGIDARGNVYGADMVYQNPFHAFVWDGGLHDLGVATDVQPPDSSGRIYGTSTRSDGAHLIEFAGGTVLDYGVPFAGFQGGRIGGGLMVGTIDPDFMLETAFVYPLPNGPVRAPLGIRSGQFMGVNTKGDVVGALLDANIPRHAILVQQGRLVDLTASLNDPSWDLLSAAAINDRGQIVGVGTRNGRRVAFLLTPAGPDACAGLMPTLPLPRSHLVKAPDGGHSCSGAASDGAGNVYVLNYVQGITNIAGGGAGGNFVTTLAEGFTSFRHGWSPSTRYSAYAPDGREISGIDVFAYTTVVGLQANGGTILVQCGTNNAAVAWKVDDRGEVTSVALADQQCVSADTATVMVDQQDRTLIAQAAGRRITARWFDAKGAPLTGWFDAGSQSASFGLWPLIGGGAVLRANDTSGPRAVAIASGAANAGPAPAFFLQEASFTIVRGGKAYAAVSSSWNHAYGAVDLYSPSGESCGTVAADGQAQTFYIGKDGTLIEQTGMEEANNDCVTTWYPQALK